MRFNPFVPHGPEPFTPTPKSGGPVLSTVEFFKKKIDELFRKDSTSVHYTHEDKTDEEKTIARDNIGAQEKLVSGVNLKTVRGQSLLGSGDVPQVPAEWGGIMGNLGMQTDLAEALGGKADRSDVYTKSEADAAIVANVENSVTSTSTTKALSAKMGKELQDQIQNLKQRGRYLSIWDCTTGLAKTEPIVNPYAYKAGDYFIVGMVGATNYRPNGAQYDKTIPSTTVETGSPIVNDTYYYDGTSWTLLHTEQPEISWGSVVGKPTTFPPEAHTHTKSEITDFPTEMPPTAHSHASDGWFTTAINSKADEAKPSFSTITINGVDYTEWTLGTRSGKIMLSVDMGGISTEIAAFNPVTGVFESAPSQYRNTLRFDGEAPVVGASPTLFDHVARESALNGKANISHTHTKSEITDFPTSMSPTAHSHESDSWFTTALGRKLDVDGPTVESGMTVKGSIYSTGIYTGYDEDPTSTRYAPEHIENGGAVILLPLSSGTFALTSDIPDPVEVIDPASATEAGKAADALATKNALDGMITANDVKRVYNVNGTQYIDGDGGVYTAQFEKGGHWTKKQGSQNARYEYTGFDISFSCYRWKDTVNANHTCLYSPSTGKFSAFGASIETGKKGLNPENGDDIGGPYTVVGATFTFFKQDSVFPSEPQDKIAKKSELDGKANSSDIPSLSGQTFDMSVDAQFKDMCIAVARELGAVVTHTTDDMSTGGQVAQAYGITPTDATTFGELQTKAGLNDSDTLGNL